MPREQRLLISSEKRDRHRRTLDMGHDDPGLLRTRLPRVLHEEQSAPRLIGASIFPRLPFAGLAESTDAVSSLGKRLTSVRF